MHISEEFLEIREVAGAGYRPVVDYGGWRVAILNFVENLLPENLDTMQRHDETDEVFVLLAGRCILFIGTGSDEIVAIQAVDMQPGVVYNVRKSVWHTHTLSRDARVLVVENRDTTYDNSPFCRLSSGQQQQISGLALSLWKPGIDLPG